MHALRWSADSGVRLVETIRPSEPSSSDHVIVRVAYAAVCGSDLHIISGRLPAKLDVILGHEFSGVVIKVGRDVTSCTLGDRVSINPTTSCGTCQHCRQGLVNHCSVDGMNSINGIFTDGGWAEFCEVRSSQVFQVPAKLPLKMAVLCEPLSCIIHGHDRNGVTPLNSRMMVMGAGGGGLLWASLLHHYGYRDVTIVQRSKERQKIAEAMEFDFRVCHPDVIEAEEMGNNGKGYDVIVDCTGNPNACESAFRWLRAGGRLNIYGCCPVNSKMTINPLEMAIKEISVYGSMVNPFTFPRAVSMVTDMAERYLDFPKLGAEIFTLDQFEAAIEAIKTKTISKAVFHIAGEL